MIRRKRMVRLHMAGDAPSLEGVFCGFWAGHYRLRIASVMAGADKTIELEGPESRVPKERVVFMQVLR